jgi:two-component system chemotaxis response regulator CheY
MPKNLLVVDDSKTMQRVFEIIFAHEDVRVIKAHNMDEAARALGQVKPDAALVDAVLPGTNGYDVVAHLKADPALAGIPLLMLACTAEPFDENRARAAGATAWIQKPVDSTGVLEKVMGAMGVAPVSWLNGPLRPAGSAPLPRPAAPPPPPSSRATPRCCACFCARAAARCRGPGRPTLWRSAHSVSAGAAGAPPAHAGGSCSVRVARTAQHHASTRHGGLAGPSPHRHLCARAHAHGGLAFRASFWSTAHPTSQTGGRSARQGPAGAGTWT